MLLLRPLPLAALAVLVLMGAAFAHAKMTATIPKDSATVAVGLSQIEMRFSKPMRLTLVRVHRAADDAQIAVQGALPKAFADAAKLAVDPLSPGAYDVSWTAVSEDGHVIKGKFAFTVAGAPAQ